MVIETAGILVFLMSIISGIYVGRKRMKEKYRAIDDHALFQAKNQAKFMRNLFAAILGGCFLSFGFIVMILRNNSVVEYIGAMMLLIVGLSVSSILVYVRHTSIAEAEIEYRREKAESSKEE